MLSIFCSAHDIIALFQKLQRDDGSGHVDMDRTWDAMKEVRTTSGRILEDNELEKFLKLGAGEDKQIDIVKFINIISRIKQFRG